MTMSVAQTTGACARGGGFTGAVRSEWGKLWSVRSTRWSLLGALALAVGHVLIITLSATASHANGIEVRAVSPMAVATISVMNVALSALIVPAALSIAGEYATGSIRSTLQWVPRRGRMLVSKAAVVVPVLFACGVVVGTLGAGIAKAVLGELAVGVAGGEAARQLAALGGYVALVGVTTVGLGAVVRSVAGTIASTIALLWVVPQVLSGLGIEVAARIADYFPGGAGMALLGAEGMPYGPAAAAALLVAWASAALVAGRASLLRRDA
jgi:hypothetical protein